MTCKHQRDNLQPRSEETGEQKLTLVRGSQVSWAHIALPARSILAGLPLHEGNDERNVNEVSRAWPQSNPRSTGDAPKRVRLQSKAERQRRSSRGPLTTCYREND